ncbi:MAG: major outer membrane protein [Campylobacterota bacterium]|nr:major outer membrane protein [Campylobacterota bacterium]
MKLVKMSLVAAMLLGASAFAIDNVKVSGDAKLFYTTQDDNKGELFDKGASTGEVALSLGVTADLTEGVSAGTTLNAITTLGLYNNLVSATWTGGIQDYYWFSEAWLAGTAGKTTAKVGRMQLDTPLVFSETWSVAPNTFEAAVLINTDLPGTTLVGAYVGQHNSASVLGGGFDGSRIKRDDTGAVVVNPDDGLPVIEPTGDSVNNAFESFYNGAYAIGAVNNSFAPLTAQAWYFDAPQAVKAYWLQADLNIEGIMAGLQYTGADWTITDSDNTAFAGMLGYEMKDTFTAKASFSSVDKDEKSGMGAGFNLAGSQSKLYTEAWWYYGVITLPDTTAMNVTLTAPVADLFDAGVYYTQATIGKNGDGTAEDQDFSEATFELAKSFGPLDVGLYYIYTKYDADNEGDAYNTVQAYLTYNF